MKLPFSQPACCLEVTTALSGAGQYTIQSNPITMHTFIFQIANIELKK
jgi:hypothetical protein